MKNKRNKNNDDISQAPLSLPQIFKDDCTNEDIAKIIFNFENSTTAEKQVNAIHSFSTYLNTATDHDRQFILKILSILFVNSSPKSPVKKSILRIFANTSNLHSQISSELSNQFLNLITNVTILNDNFEKRNDCINSINDCFNNCSPGLLAVSSIVNKAFDFLITCLKLYVDNLSDVASPIILQEFYLYIHNTTRSLVAVCQQCDVNAIITDYFDDIVKYCVVVLNNQDISFDSKNNCGIILAIAANSSDPNGYLNLLKISLDKSLSKWNTTQVDFKDDIAITCLYSGILNVVKPDYLCKYNKNFEQSDIFLMTNKLLEISKSAADKPSVALGINRTLLLVSRSLSSLNENDLIKILNDLLDHTWTHLNHFIDTVRHVSKSILVNLVKLGNTYRQNGQDSCLNFIIDSVLQASLLRNRRYVALSVIANEIGCEILLKKESNLIAQLLQQSQDSSISSYVISCYENLMQCHLKEVDEQTWLNIWVLPLITDLGENDDLDQKKTFLQKLLIVAIKLRPSILDTLLAQWSTDNEIQLNSLLKCTLIARKIGIVPKSTENKWRGLLDYSILDITKCHRNDEIRVTSLSLIANSHKSTEIFPKWELKYIVSYLHFNINTQLPSTRQQILFLIKKILTRFSESYYGILRDYNKLNEKLLNNADKDATLLSLKEQKQTYENFIFELRICIFDSLFPGANFSRRIICLEVLSFLEPILHAVLKSSTIQNNYWTSKQVEAVMLCLHDSYESNKVLATNLLRNCPTEYLKIHDVESAKQFLNSALHLAASVKPADTVTAAYMLQTSIYSPVLKDVLFELLPLDATNPDFNKEYLLIQLVFHSLKLQVDIGKKNLLKAASSAPMHGTLFCLRHLLEKYLFDSKWNEDYWKKLIEEIILICFEISEIVSPVVNNSSPEGHLPMDHGTCDENDDGTITAQMLLVCSWRSIKEVSLLLGETVLKSPITSENRNGLITEVQILKIGEHFTILLTETKHRGAFEQAYVGFLKLCTRLWGCKSKMLYQLPTSWLNAIINEISGRKSVHNSKLCATRRSAGVPFMIQAILASELRAGSNSSFFSTMFTLLELANYSGDKVETRTHSMNILRALYRHTSFGEIISHYVADGISVAITGFGRNTWAERNSATLLFSSLMTRIFGVQRSRDTEKLSIRNRMTARIFFLHYPSLHPFLLKQLKQLTATKSDSVQEVALYPILLLLARLYPASNEEIDTNNQLEDFIPYVRKCANNRILRIRELAAKALVPLVSVQNRCSLLNELFSRLEDKGCNNNYNYIHGILLQILHILRATQDFNNHSNISILINNTSWILVYNNEYSCAITSALYMQIIILLTTKFIRDKDTTENILSIINKQDEYVTENCIVGKVEYQKFVAYLQLHLSITHDSCLKICEYIIYNINHESKERKDVTLNFLIYLFKNAENSFIINDLEIPEEENLLVNLLTEGSRGEIITNLKTETELIPALKLIIENNFKLNSKALFVISNFEEAVLELQDEENKFSYFEKQIYSGDDDMAVAALSYLRVLFRNLTKIKFENVDFCDIFDTLLEFSTANHNTSCRYCVALILLENSKLLFGEFSIKCEYLIILWRIVMQLLGDSELIVRNTISKLTRNLQLAEKCREDLLTICVEQIQNISEDNCISLLLFWSIIDRDTVENNDEEDDLEVHIFEKGEISTYVEDMCLSKLSSKMLSTIINFGEKADKLNRIINILKETKSIWSGNINEWKIIVSVLENILNGIRNTSDYNILSVTEKCLDEYDDVIFKYKVENIINSIFRD